MDILEFRESYINEDIIAESINTTRYAVEVFIENAADILKNDYSLLTEINQCYYSFNNGTRAYKNIRRQVQVRGINMHALICPGTIIKRIIALVDFCQ